MELSFIFVLMLNIGLIGKTENLEPHVKRIQKNKNVNVIGKTSVGTDSSLNSFHFSIPEFNRVELIERADVFLIDNSSLISFNSICDIVKKSKHIFTTDYLNISIEQCLQLVKLANESGSVIQISNPYFFTPEIQWLNKNLIAPTFLDISYFHPEIEKNKLFQLLLMLIELTGISPKKIGASLFQSGTKESKFHNIRLEFGDASVVNLNYGNLNLLKKFKIKAYSPEQFVKLNFENKGYSCNYQPVNISGLAIENEFDTFINTIINRTKIISGIEDYLIALSAVQKIDKKLSQFSTT